MAITQCVECDKEIDVEPRRVGIHVICDYCGAEMEVVSTDPLELDLVVDGASTTWGAPADDEELDELDELDALDDEEEDEFDEEDDDFGDLDDDEFEDDDDFDYDDDDFDDDDFDYDDDDDDSRW